MMKQQAAGAELGRVKVLHINPSDKTIDFLLNGYQRPAAVEPQAVASR